ncbi:LuxR C-terminal-related transcriptional regulator [Streptomyces pristinaespiralis]|uniref:Large transcriptional regulator n=2 Tax=Streptomyces pristinaespiralis TaxID=38300 RepID=B5H8N3_STRE2|nr:LuxR family transcriptional regulator [Streptomyces pristinaespiralis]ALC20327.1 large transcriptional regulator [Streptomyces pristinaespiralis]EDY63194.2 large transcriptional regulator [Streptomyces pristinaespiralis ATCC 25486]QMU16806.1 helix-turn-helix domain-containing protein [Streptomyces pristinaespiralis]
MSHTAQTAHTAEAALRERLSAALDQQGPGRPLLLLVEGAAGTGKSRLVERLRKAVPDTVRRAAPGDPLPGEGPVLLLVEDVHRAAGDDGAALRALLTDPPSGLVCVLSYRPEELAVPGLVLGPDTEFPARLTVVRHVVGTLGVAAVHRMAADVLGEDRCTRDLAEALHRVSGGVAQTVADLLDLIGLTAARTPAGRQPGSVDVDRLGSPPRLTALMVRRTTAVPEGYRRIVLAAAVLAEPASAGELAAVAGLTRSDGQDALLAALRHAALDERGDGRYGFFSPAAAAAVRGWMPGPVREEMHRRTAHMLTRRQPIPWERVAGHRRACGDERGWLHAVERAARQLEDAGDQQRAARLLETALTTGPVPRHARPRLAMLLARSAVVGLRSDQTLDVLRYIVADAGLPPAVRGEIRLDLGLLQCNQMGQVVEGRDELARAVEELAGRPVPLARAMSALAMPYGPDAPFAENIVWIERAVKVADESGDPVVQTAVAANHVSVLLNSSDPAAWPLIESLPRDSDLAGCRQQTARGLCNAADATVWLGQYEKSRALLVEGVDLAARSGAAYAEQTGRGCALVLDWATGRWSGLADRARAFVDDAGDMPYLASDARMVLGLLALGRGEWADAVDHLTGPGAADLDSGPVPISATASGALIRLALAHDDIDAAVAEAAAAWKRLRAKGIWAWGAELAPWAVEATARAEAVDSAREMTAEFAAGLEGKDAPSASAALRWTFGVLAEHTGRIAEAATCYGSAATAYTAMNRPYHAALTSADAARCTLALDSGSGPAVAALADCAAVFDTLGATWDAARVRTDLRRHHPAQEPRVPGRPRYGDLLSPRESEVAQLAVAGMTNREIASTLHLSPRTVEQHVARAIHKSGARSRQGLGPALGTVPAEVLKSGEQPGRGR